jgi:hypothetical protein
MEIRRELIKMRDKSIGTTQFMAALAIAKEKECLVRSPLQPDIIEDRVEGGKLPKGLIGNELILLRIASQSLGRTPVRSTLRETLELTRSKPAQRLREVMTEWLTVLRDGETRIFERVAKDVALAQKGLKKAHKIGKGGSLITWLSIPVAAAELVFGSPALIAMGVAAIGGGVEAVRGKLESKYRWAMFGTI